MADIYPAPKALAGLLLQELRHSVPAPHGVLQDGLNERLREKERRAAGSATWPHSASDHWLQQEIETLQCAIANTKGAQS